MTVDTRSVITDLLRSLGIEEERSNRPGRSTVCAMAWIHGVARPIGATRGR